MKKIVALFMVTMLLVMMTPISAFAGTSVSDTWDGSIDTAWYEADPASLVFEINTAEELAGLAKIVDDKTDSFTGRTIILMKHLDLAGKEWNPIGDNSFGFKGSFLGNNYKISNLSVNGSDSLGLFAKVDGIFYIEDVALINVNITATDRNSVGALVGSAGGSGTINNCYVSGGKITSGGDTAGGLVGFSTISIRNSYASIDVTGNTRIGGLVGLIQNSMVINCFATGNVSGADYVGGLVGAGNYGVTIENSYAAGRVTTTGSSSGGLFGGRASGFDTGVFAITNSYGNNVNQVKGSDSSNGDEYIIGTSGATTSQMKASAFQIALNLGDARFPFGTDTDFNGGYPYLVTIPQIMTGDEQTIKQGETLVIKTTSPYFASAGLGMVTEVDGKVVASEMVSYEEGSTIMTLSGDYTSTLPVGTYNINIGSSDMGVARGTFTVVEASADTDVDEETAPQTGDNSSLLGMLLVMGASVMGFATIKKRNRA